MAARGGRCGPSPIGAATSEPVRPGGRAAGGRGQGRGRGGGGKGGRPQRQPDSFHDQKPYQPSSHFGPSPGPETYQHKDNYIAHEQLQHLGTFAQGGAAAATLACAPPPPNPSPLQDATVKNDTEYQKKVAYKLLDALDDESLWHLAGVLQARGLITCKLPPYPGQSRSSTTPTGSPTPTPSATSPSAYGAAPHSHTPSQASTTPGFEKAPVQRELPQTGGAAAPGPSGGASSAGEAESTTLILRNLPSTFDQQTAQEWVNVKGYFGLYDFLLWFPAKKTSRLNTSSYAFVNFRTANVAVQFREQFHLARFPAPEGESGSRQQWPLSIAVAKVQGFAENYIRFHHLLDDRSPTLCQPFFAKDAVEQLSAAEKEAAAAATTGPTQLENSQDGPCTTLIIRNLPDRVDNQEVARSWLDARGFSGQYDFFLYLPAKRRRPDPDAAPAGPPQGLGYAFVNLKDPSLAQAAAEALNGRSLADGDPVLNVVAARVQGYEECLGHFSTLADNGRVVPWTEIGISAPFPLHVSTSEVRRVEEQLDDDDNDG
eukprot:CAMPEP_0168411840 /NCGR_PEP_ID=MMETSP0228-20121227/28404_1 /TAXON_ID=133427 /ORGANISM="Protoceratium reticulatum, Strain CCCM 535 (=CCMP 1889)" /LENGTH=542 /DNA_ID=CAMNT_0008425591 /DNA_START=81 /DNA_END=1706 /DNA_ORIENTATION=-